jgi:phosphatidylinositol phospholipase C delta
MGSYAYKYCMCFTRKFRSPDAQPPPDVRAAHLSYCCSSSSSSSEGHGLRRFLSQVQGEPPADADRILATLAPTWAAHGIARLVTRSPAAPPPPTLEEFFGFLFSSDLNPPINNQVRCRRTLQRIIRNGCRWFSVPITGGGGRRTTLLPPAVDLLPSNQMSTPFLPSSKIPLLNHLSFLPPLGCGWGWEIGNEWGWEIGRQRQTEGACLHSLLVQGGRCSILGSALTFHFITTTEQEGTVVQMRGRSSSQSSS